MTFDPTKPCRTKEGCKARFLGRVKSTGIRSLIFAIMSKDKSHEYILNYAEDGCVHATLDIDCRDLINITEISDYQKDALEIIALQLDGIRNDIKELLK